MMSTPRPLARRAAGVAITSSLLAAAACSVPPSKPMALASAAPVASAAPAAPLPSATPAPHAGTAHHAPAWPDPPAAEVSIRSGALKLRGYVVRPSGDGPFPVVVYNHGSERDVDIGFFAELGAWWQANGYAVVFPFRRGVGGSEGTYWKDDAGDLETDAGISKAVARLDVDNDDVVAALAWAANQPYADAKRIAVAGCSFGGIQSLITSARTTPARAALDFAGGSMMWAKWEPLRDRMHKAAKSANVPVFFLQAKNDFDTSPSLALADVMEAAKRAHRVHIYEAHGKTPMAGHGGFCLRGMPQWGDDVLEFLNASFSGQASNGR